MNRSIFRSVIGFALLLSGLALAAVPAAAQAQPARATIQLPPEFDRVLRDYESAWRARDADRLSRLFHENGFVLSQGAEPVRGRAAIARHYGNAGGALHLRALAYAKQDTIAYIVGIYGGTETDESGKFLLALQRADTRSPWLIAADMDNPITRR